MKSLFLYLLSLDVNEEKSILLLLLLSKYLREFFFVCLISLVYEGFPVFSSSFILFAFNLINPVKGLLPFFLCILFFATFVLLYFLDKDKENKSIFLIILFKFI